jgi:hypothetical protein
MQEICDYIKRPTLQIIGIEEEEEQAKGTGNIFNKIMPKGFPNLERDMPIQVQVASRTPNRYNQDRYSPHHIIVKTLITEKKERIFFLWYWGLNSGPSP